VILKGLSHGTHADLEPIYEVRNVFAVCTQYQLFKLV